MRNSAIGKAEAYHNKGEDNVEFDTTVLVKKITDHTPLFDKHVAARLAQKHVDNAHQVIASSIMGKALGIEKANTSDEYIKFAKTQKKDSLYA